MKRQGYIRIRTVCLVCSILVLGGFSPRASAQSAAGNPVAVNAREEQARKLGDSDAQYSLRRAFAISLVISLGNEARGYSDLALRPRVLARTADALWDVDNVTARALFVRAWDAAEKGDGEEPTTKTKDNPPAMVVSLRRMGGRDLRSEVASIAAKRDRALGEEFLAKLKKEDERDLDESKSTKGRGDSWSPSETALKRLLIAGKLLKDGDVERALEFANPALDQVNQKSVGFLSELRRKNSQAADRVFALMLTRAELDPTTDANTVSGLSSYVFTPGLYIVFNADGQTFWTEPDGDMAVPVDLPVAIREEFFRAAATILLRPIPPRDQDFTTAGRWGKYMVIQRLLPLFDQYAPDVATGLRTQLTELKGNWSKDVNHDDGRLLTAGIKPEASARDVFEKLQYDLDHAGTSRERDEICGVAAIRLATKGDVRARDIADKIDESERRTKIREYVDFELIRIAIRKNAPQETARLAQNGQLTHAERAWAYTQAARLLVDSHREEALAFLDQALDEVQRIDGDGRDSAILLFGVARQFLAVDRVRAWEAMNQAVKAANRTDNFTGENSITFWASAGGVMKFNQFGGEDGGLPGMFRLLARDNLDGSVDLAKRIRNDGPRAAAMLAIAGALLEKQITK
jgi:hypothetical protein